MSAARSENINVFSSPRSAEPIRLHDYQDRTGILQSIIPGEDGYILADLSGALVELPVSIEKALRAHMGKRVRVGRFYGKYLVAAWRPWA